MDIKTHDYSWAPEFLRPHMSHIKGRIYVKCVTCGKIRRTNGRSQLINVPENFIYCTEHRTDSEHRNSAEEIASWPMGTKRCIDCRDLQPLVSFELNKKGLLGRRAVCKKCKAGGVYSKFSFEYTLFKGAQYRANKKNRIFDIVIEDIIIPKVCPLLKVAIEMERNSDYAPSIDRIDSSGGYTKNNIIVMSKRGNTLKNNMTLSEALLVAEFLTKQSVG